MYTYLDHALVDGYSTRTLMARPATSGLSRERVVDAAEALVVDEGFDRLSLRTLAQRLGVAPMTLYRYVGTKEELLGALADRMLEDLEIRPPARARGRPG